MEDPSGEVTVLLRQFSTGHQEAMQRLMPLIYAELHRLAAHYMRHERKDHTLQPTALVHEAYLRLVNRNEANWKNKAHFFGVAAQVMRGILTDYARSHCRVKRGGHRYKLSLDEVVLSSEESLEEILDIDEALNRLAKLDARQSKIVELRIFAGLTVSEIAAILGVSPRTVKREWSSGRVWPFNDLSGGGHAAKS